MQLWIQMKRVGAEETSVRQSKEEPEPNTIQQDSDAHANSAFVVELVQWAWKENVSRGAQKEKRPQS